MWYTVKCGNGKKLIWSVFEVLTDFTFLTKNLLCIVAFNGFKSVTFIIIGGTDQPYFLHKVIRLSIHYQGHTVRIGELSCLNIPFWIHHSVIAKPWGRLHELQGQKYKDTWTSHSTGLKNLLMKWWALQSYSNKNISFSWKWGNKAQQTHQYSLQLCDSHATGTDMKELKFDFLQHYHVGLCQYLLRRFHGCIPDFMLLLEMSVVKNAKLTY